jgi:hypothetical protein
MGRYVHGLLLEGEIDARPLLDLPLAASLLWMLPNLQTLLLSCVRLRGQPSDLQLIPSMSPTVRFNLCELCFLNVGSRDDRCGDLLQFLRLFNEVGRLSIHANNYPVEDVCAKGAFPSSLRTQFLVVTGSMVPAPGVYFYLDVVGRTGSLHSLSVIEVEFIQREDFLALENLIKLCGPRLSRVALSVRSQIELVKGAS